MWLSLVGPNFAERHDCPCSFSPQMWSFKTPSSTQHFNVLSVHFREGLNGFCQPTELIKKIVTVGRISPLSSKWWSKKEWQAVVAMIE